MRRRAGDRPLMSQADFWQYKESAEANRQLHAGATCALLPKKHQAAWHRPDNPKRSTGDAGAKSFSTKKQVEWKLSGNTAGTELRLGGNAAERRGRRTGVGRRNTKDWNQSTVVNEDSRVFPDRKMERLLSNFQAIPQYDYNFRAETLPKAEIKGASESVCAADTNVGAALLQSWRPLLPIKCSDEHVYHRTKLQRPPGFVDG